MLDVITVEAICWVGRRLVCLRIPGMLAVGLG